MGNPCPVVEEKTMASIKQNTQVPALGRPDPKIADLGAVRLGDAAISAVFPPLRRPDEKTVDPGIVRLGDAAISARFLSK
jgi:hypothetical protein